MSERRLDGCEREWVSERENGEKVKITKCKNGVRPFFFLFFLIYNIIQPTRILFRHTHCLWRARKMRHDHIKVRIRFAMLMHDDDDDDRHTAVRKCFNFLFHFLFISSFHIHGFCLAVNLLISGHRSANNFRTGGFGVLHSRTNHLTLLRRCDGL